MTVSTTKENLKVAGRFIQTLMTKLPEIVDTNPVKMALSLAKVIIEIKKVCHYSLARSLTDNHPGRGGQHGCCGAKDSIYRSTVGYCGKGTGWLACEQRGRNAMR